MYRDKRGRSLSLRENRKPRAIETPIMTELLLTEYKRERERNDTLKTTNTYKDNEGMRVKTEEEKGEKKSVVN